jgi:hypothetical protein
VTGGDNFKSCKLGFQRLNAVGLCLSSVTSTATRALPSFARCLGSRNRFANARATSDEQPTGRHK